MGQEAVGECRVVVEARRHLVHATTSMVVGVSAVAVAIRRVCPARQPSPRKSPRSSSPTTASFPVRDRTESFTVPFSMNMTLVPSSP